VLGRIRQLLDHTWVVAALSLLIIALIAAPLSYLILLAWDEWKVFIALLYAFLFIGVWADLPSRSFIGNVITIGIFFGLFIPVVVWLAQRGTLRLSG